MILNLTSTCIKKLKNVDTFDPPDDLVNQLGNYGDDEMFFFIKVLNSFPVGQKILAETFSDFLAEDPSSETDLLNLLTSIFGTAPQHIIDAMNNEKQQMKLEISSLRRNL